MQLVHSIVGMKCHCGKDAVNVTGDLCDEHLAEFKKQQEKKRWDDLATAKYLHRYYMPDSDLETEWRDAGPWRSYHVSECAAETLKEFFEELTISEIDQDGGDLDVYGYADAPRAVQLEILGMMGIDKKDAEAFE